MQGTAADIINLAMIRVAGWLGRGEVNARLITQVHNELVFEAHEDDTESLIAWLSSLMCEAVELSVPLKVHAAARRNQEDAH